MTGKRILMIVGDFSEDYETMAPRDLDLPIRGLDAEGILRREAARLTSSSRLASLARSPVGAPPASAP